MKVRMFLYPQKALSDKVGHIAHALILLVCSAFHCMNVDVQAVAAILTCLVCGQRALTGTGAGM